jgi:hypothetical protein
MLLGLLSLVLYVVDICTDLWLARSFLHNEDYVYFGVTLALVLVTWMFNLVMTLHTHSKHFHGWQRVPVGMAAVLNLGPCIT